MSENTRESLWERCGGATPRDRRNMAIYLGSLVVWAICLTGATLLIKKGLLPEGPIPWLAATLPSVAAIFVIVTYARFLRQADELQRAIQLKALATGFGAGWFFTSGYRIFERLGAPAADGSDTIVVMAVAYSIGSVLGAVRYR